MLFEEFNKFGENDDLVQLILKTPDAATIVKATETFYASNYDSTLLDSINDDLEDSDIFRGDPYEAFRHYIQNALMDIPTFYNTAEKRDQYRKEEEKMPGIDNFIAREKELENPDELVNKIKASIKRNKSPEWDRIEHLLTGWNPKNTAQDMEVEAFELQLRKIYDTYYAPKIIN